MDFMAQHITENSCESLGVWNDEPSRSKCQFHEIATALNPMVFLYPIHNKTVICDLYEAKGNQVLLKTKYVTFNKTVAEIDWFYPNTIICMLPTTFEAMLNIT